MDRQLPRNEKAIPVACAARAMTTMPSAMTAS
jgi:hypothetical protein